MTRRTTEADVRSRLDMVKVVLVARMQVVPPCDAHPRSDGGDCAACAHDRFVARLVEIVTATKAATTRTTK